MFVFEEVSFEKMASTSSAKEACQEIMERIYGENPTYWPYGLNIEGHNSGGVYLVKDAKTKKAVGFTGWQVQKRGSRKIGYYSIGILPEYRGNGFAKSAVSQLLRSKIAEVDEVRAFIVPHNTPSMALAEQLGVSITHRG
jgi:RimJ/RimL family protein N-acetyltransferase